jgi:hypothetical protein
MNRLGAIAIAAGAIGMAAGLFATASSGAPKAQKVIGLVGVDRPIGDGAQAAAAALGDQLVMPGGHTKAAILSLISEHADAIVVGSDGLSDTDGSGLALALAKAQQAGIPTLSFEQSHPGSVWVRQSSSPYEIARALADALASQMNERGQFVIVSCRQAGPAVGPVLEQAKSYIQRRYPHMQLAAVAQRGFETRLGVWSQLTLGPVLSAHPHLRGLMTLCGAAPVIRKVSSVGVSSWCPPLGIPDAYPILSGATELVCTADWTKLGYLVVWAADRLAAGVRFRSGRYDVGGPIGPVRFYNQDEELRLVVPPLALTKTNVAQYVSRPTAPSARPTNGAPSTVKQASDMFSIEGIGELNNRAGPTGVSTLGFDGTASPFKQISFFGASDWHFTKVVSLPGSTCSLTPANGGATCKFANPELSVAGGRFGVDGIFRGTPPMTVTGEVVFADDSTEEFSASVAYPPRVAAPSVWDAVLTGMKDGKPHLGFKLRGAERDNPLSTAKLISFRVTLPGGLGFDLAKVAKGTACDGPGNWKSSSISSKQMRCTPRFPLSVATAVTNLRISAIQETTRLEREVKHHEVVSLPFWVTAWITSEHSKHGLIHLRGVGAIEN